MRSILILASSIFLASCNGGSKEPVTAGGSNATTDDQRPMILCLGNSLTAAYGLDPDEGWVAVLQKRIDSLGLNFRMVNGGVSGETTSGLRSRMGWMLQANIHTIIIESGANDGLRGTQLGTTRENLRVIIDTIRVYNPSIKILLAGMMVPPNMGSDYTNEFRTIYPGLAKEKQVNLIPFFLENVGGIPALNLPDGIHPNVEGQKVVANTVWKYLEPMLRDQPSVSSGAGGQSARSMAIVKSGW